MMISTLFMYSKQDNRVQGFEDVVSPDRNRLLVPSMEEGPAAHVQKVSNVLVNHATKVDAAQ